MEFDTSSPIWVQLVDEFSRRIATGEWAVGSKLPGVRELASGLGVNPNTAQRALAELERLGLCRTERATGRFVTDDESRIDEARVTLAAGAADEFVRRARGLQMAREQACTLLDQRWDSHDHHTTDVPDHGGA